MKNKYKFYTVAVLSAFLYCACNEHDSFDDNVLIGEMAPQADWTLISSEVSAGSGVEFTSEYYTTGSADINRVEVWYNVEQTIKKVVDCPWVVSKAYSKSSESTQEIRISQKIIEYAHDPLTWDASSMSYRLNSSFPTSYALSSINWKEPTSFGAEDSVMVKRYFSENYMQEFKDELYQEMKFADFKNLCLGLNFLEDFSQYTDSTKNENSGLYDYHFPKDEGGNEVVPQEIKEIYESISFGQLIFNSSKGLYSIEYKREHALNAVMKVMDNAGNTGVTRKMNIKLN